MRFIRKLMIGLAALAAMPLAAQGPIPAPAAKKAEAAPLPAAKPVQTANLTPTDLEAFLDGFLPYALERARIPGAVVVVVRGDQVVLEKGYGFSDVAKRKPVLPETTLFRPGSVSKLFTWTAVMQQVEAGKLDLDKDVNTYLDFKIPPFEGKPITLRNIMTHTAGFEESVRYLISSDPKAAMALKKQMPLALPQRVFAPRRSTIMSTIISSSRSAWRMRAFASRFPRTWLPICRTAIPTSRKRRGRSRSSFLPPRAACRRAAPTWASS